MQLDAKIEAFWQVYLSSLPHAKDAVHRFYDVMRIGNSNYLRLCGCMYVPDHVAMGVYREPDRDRPLARVASERPLDHSFRVFFGDRQGKL